MQRNITLTFGDDEAYETAKRAALQRLERGSHLGGGLLPTREELHDRADLRKRDQ
jgi:hypothetical protein